MSLASQTSNSRLWIQHPLACADPAAAGGVVIQGTRIIERVAAGHRPSEPVDQSFDASQHVLLPGLVNTHHHFYQTLTRAYTPALNKELFPWLTTLYDVWANLDEEQLEVASELAMAELLLSGCTTVADHHYVFSNALAEAIDRQVETARRLGVRAALTRGSMSVGRDDGGLPPQFVVQDEATILDDSRRLISRYHQREEGAMVTVALAPCSPFSVSRELMKATADLAKAEDVRLHTHLAETEDETRYCQRLFGLRPLDYLDECGWLGNRTWLAHGIHFSDEEIRRLGEAGTGIAHCPSSNMVLGSGLCRTLELERAGAPVGLAVDGSASNDHSNLAEEMRQAMLLGRLRYSPAQVSHADVIRWATQGSARCLGREDIGGLAPGQQADLALFKLDEPRFSGAENPLAALLLCGAHRADRVMVAGRWRVIDSQVQNLDLEALMARHRAAAQRLWQAA
ncbi:hydroxydechloroatrazine ethylaminohydrolase [Litchfieldella anticariensis FP35 = DSM 16096]|uniref:Hydroxydechloroatrazine ethylaminohydrolase n=1 Tax=Litchfieldella anticariensis (strain DSM 16096 / CECT 5854 / CIP 108499 / LMG 22089 / FP35) TaxID=1121939 RepID=S2KPF2_LITA3|nr:8-oxoguanine deaminase [Halomonas anticariensis]EPC03957.1 hydroxydechloroatrazine ethylaminohydrolase [Halomonas anticariensis FP35 = DSM 16096]